MARSSECRDQFAQKAFDTADVVREAMLRQLMSRAYRASQPCKLLPSEEVTRIRKTTGEASRIMGCDYPTFARCCVAVIRLSRRRA
jgi:hypothetical protein